MPGKFYITTPIYYVNARPHIGHVYTTTLADIVARYHRLQGDDVFFLTGTDEHGKKVADSAREQGVSPQDFVDEIAGEFQQTFTRMALTHNDFIRTTEPRHEKRVQAYVQQLTDSGDVYLGEYEGWYDESQEEYVTETNAKANDYQSLVSGRPLVRVKEKNYFFRLSKYQEVVRQHIEDHPNFIQPDARRNEVLGRIRDGLNDVAISRSTEPWGVSMPGDEDHSVYVWIDALFNYVTAPASRDRNELWPADVHLIGKEILWFHAVIWPAVLLALGRPLYHQLYAHSFWISEGQKMSKTLGNFVDLEKLNGYIGDFGLDALRYYLATQGPMGAADADFAHAKFVEVYNSDLANTFGNCASRVANMIGRYFGGQLPPEDRKIRFGDGLVCLESVCVAASEAALQHRWPRMDLDGAADEALGVIRQIDHYIEQTQPFKMAKDSARMPEVGTILYRCAEALRIASVLLWPIIPHKVEDLWGRIGCARYTETLADRGKGRWDDWIRWGQLEPGTVVNKGDALFPRYLV